MNSAQSGPADSVTITPAVIATHIAATQTPPTMFRDLSVVNLTSFE
ncbi:MAG: hypothetical protein G01um101420_381 [Parcubacteria group bacterium Gr01-1014_20]|nr:MAG: hypothetical protein G01um101420_381 [Parcubacteria group bacterium Gr01-1014_20]